MLPSSGLEYRDSGEYRNSENFSSASPRGSVSSWRISARRSALRRSISRSGKTGLLITSPRSCVASSSLSDSVVILMTALSQSAPDSRDVPSCSNFSANSAPSSLLVPSRIPAAVSAAIPSFPRFSFTDPASTITRTVASGSLSTGAVTTRIPFGSTSS